MKKKMDILYEDKELLIVNKPSGLLTIGTGKEKIRTLYHEAREYIKKQNPHYKIFIVNRLDKDTSGIVVFAKSESSKKILQDNWNKYALNREYIAIVEGHVAKRKDTLKSYLKESKSLEVYTTSDAKNGKLAITEYEKLAENKRFTLLKINIKTGRKNQIRVQLNEMGNPIIGDKKYGAKTNPINRLGLHASSLTLVHPISKKEIIVNAKAPKVMELMFDI